MDQPLKKSAQSVQSALAEKGFSSKIIEFSASTRTAQEAAAAIGCEIAQIVKSLIFKTKETHQPVLVFASGITRVNEQKIELEMDEKIIKADADFVRQVTGFAIGGIPPIGHKQVIESIFIDQDLLNFDILWAAAGTPNTVFSLPSKALLEMTHGKVISII